MTQPTTAEQPDPQPWRCTRVLVDVDNDRTTRCWLPDGHHGRDASNNWDLHQDSEGNQW